MTWRRRILIGAAALVLGAGACSSDGDTSGAPADSAAPTESVATTDPDTDGCVARLKAVEAAVEIGDVGAAKPVDLGGLPACQAQVSASPFGAVKLQVIDVSAMRWVMNVGPILEQFKGRLDEENDRKLEEGLALLETDDFDGPRACELFTTMVVTIQGAPAGARRIVNYLPDLDDPLAANAQSCLDGRFRSVQLEGEIEVAEALTNQLMVALESLESA